MEMSDLLTAACAKDSDIDDIDDIMLEILRRLPAKSRAVFSSVSSTWRRRIRDNFSPIIEEVHLLVKYNHLHPDLSLNVHYMDNRKIVYSCSKFLPNRASSGALLNSCNGLLLTCQETRKPLKYLVCNPLTKQFACIQVIPDRNDSKLDAALAYDPLKSPHYKVVVFRDNNMLLEVFSSETWHWKALNLVSETALTDVRFRKGPVFFNGAIYRLSRSRRNHVFKFCFDEEETRAAALVRALELPGTGSAYRNEECLGPSGGALCFARCDQEFLYIWMLSESGTRDACNWILKHKISVEMIRSSWEGLPSVHPCAFHPFNPEVMFLGCNGGGKYSNIYQYDLTNNKLKERRRLFSLKETENFAHYLVLPFCYSVEGLPNWNA